jgi:hypothetical protein
MLLQSRDIYLVEQCRVHILPSESDIESGHLYMLRRLTELSSHHKRSKMILNLMEAAILLHFILQGSRDAFTDIHDPSAALDCP